MTTPRKPSAILRAIGERIARPEAWTTGYWARAADGRPCLTIDPCATCWCWLGAWLVEAGPDGDDDLKESVARSDVPALVAEVRRLSADLASAKARCERMAEALQAALPLLRHDERGAHYCRGQGCSAGEHCTSVWHDSQVDAAIEQARAALADKTSADRSEKTGR